MKIRAIIFDLFGVVWTARGVDEEVINLVRKLKAGYRIGLLSNSSQRFLDRALPKQTQKLFDSVVLSEEVGLSKPDKRAYLEVSRLLGEFPSDCLMIDDAQMNYAGAIDAGMQAILFTTVSELESELQKYGILTS